MRSLPDGRWWDDQRRCWRDGRGRLLNHWPNLLEAAQARETRVVLAACHLDGNVRNNRRRNLRAWCQRCHLLHDRPQHLQQRWLAFRRRYAIGDLFLGPYEVLVTYRQRRPAASRTKVRPLRGVRLTGRERRQLSLGVARF